MKYSTKYLNKIFPENFSINNKLYPKSQLYKSSIRIPRSSSFNACITHSLPWKRTAIQVSTPPHSAMDGKVLRCLQTAGEAIRDASKTVHVKFQLQYYCCFGEQILLVGNDPTLGSWDPSSAVPLNWSEGGIWFVELDVPVELSIQFKFLLRQSTGEVLWQPGPDRVFQTWDSENTFVVAEDWDNADAQTITEEAMVNDPVSKPDSEPVEGNIELTDTTSISSSAKKGLNTEDYTDDEPLFTRDVEFPILVPGLPPTAAEK